MMLRFCTGWAGKLPWKGNCCTSRNTDTYTSVAMNHPAPSHTIIANDLQAIIKICMQRAREREKRGESQLKTEWGCCV